MADVDALWAEYDRVADECIATGVEAARWPQSLKDALQMAMDAAIAAQGRIRSARLALA
jgi:hypothetical protein